jgi:putative membrane protein
MADDYTRRTLLANERTYLAWWRTGLTSLTAALAAARVVPELANARHQWPYSLLGLALAAIGIVCVIYAERRRRAVDAAVRSGEFADPSAAVTLGMAVVGALIGVGIVVLIAFG